MQPLRTHGPLAIALLAAALATAGCGRGSDQATVRAVSDRFFAALQSGDGEQACTQLSADTRAELESQEQKPCREAITGLGLEGAPVARVRVYVLSAIVELSSGEAAFLDDGLQGWRLSAVGCKSHGKPADRPYDCELED